MSDKGVIFISIDDNEQANLKLLEEIIVRYTKYMKMERNTEKSTYEKQVKMICGYKKKLIHRRAFSLRLTRFERATPTSAVGLNISKATNVTLY